VTARYLSVADYAALAGVSHKTIRGMIARGELRAHRFGRVLRIDPDEAAEATVYQPADPADAGPRAPRPRPVLGDYSRRAREGV
jgi:excisionase family DNA binding protein